MNIKSDTNIYDQIQNDIKINESAKSSYWTALLNKIDLNNYLIEDRKLNGTFGNFSKKNIFKNFYHNFFQRILFRKYEYLNDDIYQTMKQICKKTNRNLNLDSLRHVFTHKFLEPIYNKSKKVCVIGDGRLNFSSIILTKFKKIKKLYHINLPEVLYFETRLLQGSNIIDFGSIKYVSNKEELIKAENDENIKMILISSIHSDILINNNIDIFVNIASFQEINNHVIDQYLNIIKSNQSILYHCNREEKKLIGGEVFKINYFNKYIEYKIFSSICPWHNKYYSLVPPFYLSYDGIHKHELFNFGVNNLKLKNFKFEISFIHKNPIFLISLLMNVIHKLAIFFINFFVKLILLNKKVLSVINNKINADIKFIKVKDSKLSFINSNHITNYRITNFFMKEPETLEWIDSFEENKIFWDIGANIGSYSLYAGLTKNIQIICFEPSYVNLDLLSKNIRLNKLNNKISIFPIPLSNISSSVEFKISDITPGSALSSITSYDQNGKPINEMHSFNTFSTSSDDLIDLFNLPQPDYIKIDVDGIEHLILKGAIKILQNTKSILLETNFNFEDQYLAIDRILKENGFLLHSKFFFNGSTQCNAIWNKV